jgi:transcriptional regulator NrdR family protein
MKDETLDKALAKERLQSQKCPYCGADRKDLAHGNIENDGREVFQVVACDACEKHFTEVYSFRRVILTDYPGDDFRIDFND